MFEVPFNEGKYTKLSKNISKVTPMAFSLRQ